MLPCDCYCANVRHSAQCLTTLYDEALTPLGLTVSQFYLLTRLAILKKANITQWADAAGLERTTMVRNVRALEKLAWLERAEGTGKTYMLSATGKALLRQTFPVWQDVQARIEQLLGPDDAQALLRIEAKLEAASLRK